jgi:type VI protein secretion system component Hcp
MANNPFIYMKLPGVTGDAKPTPYAGQIEILTAALGSSNDTNVHTGNTSSGNVYVSNYDCTKVLDMTSPSIHQLCLSGKITEQVILSFTRTPANTKSTAPFEYQVVTLSTVLIANYQVNSSGGGGEIESFSLHFGKFMLQYYAQKPDGSKGAVSQFTYDIAAKSMS